MQRPASPSSQRGFRPEKPPSALDQIPTPSVGSRAQSPEVEEIMKAAASIHGGNTNSHHGGRTSAMRGQDANPDRQVRVEKNFRRREKYKSANSLSNIFL